MESNDNERFSEPKRGEITAKSLPAWKWTGGETLDLLYEVNEHYLGALQKLAQGHLKEVPAGGQFDIVKQHKDLWLDIGELALRRAAQAPLLLVNVRFESEEWWRSAISHRAIPRKDARTLPIFSSKVARELMVETLLLAWHTARSDRRTATLLLGIAPAVADRIASLGPRDVRRIAAEHSRELRPRWDGNVRFWQDLLLASWSDDAESLSHAYRVGLQLLATEVLPHVR